MIIRKCIVLLAILILGACVNGSEGYSDKSILLDNIYVVEEVDFGYGGMFATLNWMFLRFHADNIVERVDMVFDANSPIGSPRYNFVKRYGIFELDGRVLTITFSGENPIIGIVQNEGETISISDIGTGTFRHFDEDRQERFGNHNEILAQFD